VGGPIDDVFAELRRLRPGLIIERLAVNRPNDDDNVWFIRTSPEGSVVQVDTFPNGYGPYLLESDDERIEVVDAIDAVAVLKRWLDGNESRG
jgi:hypothetical protein